MFRVLQIIFVWNLTAALTQDALELPLTTLIALVLPLSLRNLYLNPLNNETPESGLVLSKVQLDQALDLNRYLLSLVLALVLVLAVLRQSV